jgi:hypothetical protein
LGPEDLFELEHGAAVAQLGQRVALRQALQAAALFEAGLPAQRPRLAARQHDLATRLTMEDAYPVGGLAAITTRGSIESLLQSQLAFMERGDRPDLFDVKYVRDELLYYSRDDNQFLRRRRTFFLVFCPELAQARVKDAGLPCQRIVMLLGFLLTALRKLRDWLSTDALTFELVFLRNKRPTPLQDELALANVLLREEISGGVVKAAEWSEARLANEIRQRWRRSQTCFLVLTAGLRTRPQLGDDVPGQLLDVGQGRPRLFIKNQPVVSEEVADPVEAWRLALADLLRLWL